MGHTVGVGEDIGAMAWDSTPVLSEQGLFAPPLRTETVGTPGRLEPLVHHRDRPLQGSKSTFSM